MEERNLRKTRTGKVVSDKMDKTIVVAVEDHVKQPLYNNKIKITYRVKAHDENNECKIGDKVRVMDIIFVTTANTDEEARELLTLFNMPFAK